MSTEFRIRRYTPRSFAQISLDRTAEDSIAEELRDARRISRAIAPALKTLPLGVDFSEPGNIRLRDGKIILFVRSALQKSKLRQILPRLTDLAGKAGYLQKIDIAIRPVTEPIALRHNEAMSTPRVLSEESIGKIRSAAAGMADSPLKKALEDLALARRKRQAPTPSSNSYTTKKGPLKKAQSIRKRSCFFRRAFLLPCFVRVS